MMLPPAGWYPEAIPLLTPLGLPLTWGYFFWPLFFPLCPQGLAWPLAVLELAEP